MIKTLLISGFYLFFCYSFTQAQVFKSIHQEETENHNQKNWEWEDYQTHNENNQIPLPKTSSNCTLNKIVFGWHPYWSDGLEGNYQWNLLSDLSYFAYETDPASGQATSTHGWTTAPVVTEALSEGIRVNLCVTLFSNHAQFFGSTTSQQTLITNLINLIQQRGAHGVNIDFEAVPSSNKTQLTAFMIDLCNQMHTAIPGSQISMAIPAVDWSETYDVNALNPYVDLFLIMGYDYYYSGSAQAGPTDPLYTHISTYNYNISKSINYYLNKNIPKHKLALGLPYYGREWSTTSSAVPSNTTASGVSRTYKYVKDNITGDYTHAASYNKTMSTYYAFNNGSTWKQCFITDARMLKRRFEMVNNRGLAGIGIWALGYDDGYNEFWQAIEERFTNCAQLPCTDTLYDMGGPMGNYYNNETYTYTIAPTGGSGLSLSFNTFNTLASSDTLKIYNGFDTNAPLEGAFAGNTIPPVINSSGQALTFSFISGSGVTAGGWEALWQCADDSIVPTTAINLTNQWVNTDFQVAFTDTDNTNGSGINKSFYQVSDFDGNNWVANTNRGFLTDNFDTLNNSLWNVPVNGGIWSITNQYLLQSDTSVSNTNIYAQVDQNLSNRYLYHFKSKINGSGTNKRFGFHFFSDSAQYQNRNNSYFVWFRQATSQLELYKVSGDFFTLIHSVNNYSINNNQWVDIKLIYDKITGHILLYTNDSLTLNYQDVAPYSAGGNYISFRSGNCEFFVDNINIYRSRTSSTTILVGPSALTDIRYESPDMSTPVARIKSVTTDNANNISTIINKDLYVDYSPPEDIPSVNDGLITDVDTTYNAYALMGSWDASTDSNTGIQSYIYAIGTSPGDSNIVAWTNNNTATNVTHTGLNLIHDSIYYFSVKAQNQAGFFSNITSSDGIKVIISTGVDALFSYNSNIICTGDTISFINLSSNANSYLWTFQGGSPSTSTDANPLVSYNTPGVYHVQLIAYGTSTSDTADFPSLIHVYQNSNASFTCVDTVFISNALVAFTNNSTNALSYIWDFGDSIVSNDYNPWHVYTQPGTYQVVLKTFNNSCSDSVTKIIYVLDPSSISHKDRNASLIIFPNPFIEKIHIQFTENNIPYRAVIYDICGRKVYQQDILNIINGNAFTINNLSPLPEGFYILDILTKENHYKFKVVKK